eukprot:352048-Chlamydomonas_euryale.AAC.8
MAFCRPEQRAPATAHAMRAQLSPQQSRAPSRTPRRAPCIFTALRPAAPPARTLPPACIPPAALPRPPAPEHAG